MKNRNKTTIAVVTALTMLGAGLAITGSADVSATTIEGKIIQGEAFQRVTIKQSDISAASIHKASIEGSHVAFASVRDATIQGSYLDHLAIQRALVEDSRVERAGIMHSTLHDVTVCDAAVNTFGVGSCHLVDIEGGDLQVYARLAQDAPETIAPGGSYDLKVGGTDAPTLTVHNDPAGLVGLGFETSDDPLGLQALGFDAAASNDSIESLELIVDGAVQETFDLGDTVELPSSAFTLRVNTNDTGIIDHSRIGLVLDLDGHGLRPAITSFDVVASALAFAPLEGQLFAPFLADDVARLVLSKAVDENGNVDRDVNISTRVEVNSIASGDVELVGDPNDHARLHDDSRLFSAAPFKYLQEVDAAHHPQTLELLVRLNLVPGLEWGGVNAYGTHLVAISPFETNLTLFGETTNARGETLTAEPITLTLGPAPESSSTATVLGSDFTFPGTGTVHVNLVDGEGQPIEADDDWTLTIEETPTSHGVRMTMAIDEGATSVEQELAASMKVGTPFGNFKPNEYQVCVEHDAGRTCADGGDLVAIQTGETTNVDIVIG